MRDDGKDTTIGELRDHLRVYYETDWGLSDGQLRIIGGGPEPAKIRRSLWCWLIGHTWFLALCRVGEHQTCKRCGARAWATEDGWVIEEHKGITRYPETAPRVREERRKAEEEHAKALEDHAAALRER